MTTDQHVPERHPHGEHHHPPKAPHPPGSGGHGVEHANVRTYVSIAVILAIITALEFGVVYVRQLAPVIVPLLLAMSAAKFALVVLFFMHLKYDHRSLSFLFYGPLIIAIALAVALLTLPGEFLRFR